MEKNLHNRFVSVVNFAIGTAELIICVILIFKHLMMALTNSLIIYEYMLKNAYLSVTI